MKQWYEVKQNHNAGYFLTYFLLKCFPPAFMRFMVFPVAFFYWAFGKRTRCVSRNYLKRLDSPAKRSSSSFLHIVSFALNLVENVQGWAGKFSFKYVHWQSDDVEELVRDINEGRGCVILISHLGNAQMMKALASMGESGTERKMDITTISDAKVSGGFNALLNEINPSSSVNLVNSDDIGPETVFLLQEKLEKGGVVVIAGDRVSAHTDRNLEIDFLGQKAPFPYGVFLLTALLNAPTYFVTGLRHKDFSMRPDYDMFVKKNPLTFDCPRKEREIRIRQTACNYVSNLEALCRLHPYQWYNFFDFWPVY